MYIICIHISILYLYIHKHTHAHTHKHTNKHVHLHTQITRVPVASAAHMTNALKLLRQQLTLNELYAGCFPRDAAPSALAGQNQGTEAKIVEVSAAPPSRLFLHLQAPQGGTFQLVNMEIGVNLGGDIWVKLRCQGSLPCSDEYATEVLTTCRNVPMALEHIFAK
jgi:hypothetical protein